MFKWVHNMGVDANIAGKELETIESTHGCLTPQNVLESSRAEDAPLHKCFEWDDSIAAEKYRLRQAGSIIRNIVVVNEAKGEAKQIRAFVNVEPKCRSKCGVFVNVRKAMEEEESRETVLQNAKLELAAFKSKYITFATFDETWEKLFSTIEEIAQD